MLQKQQEYHNNKVEELQEAQDILQNDKNHLIFQIA